MAEVGNFRGLQDANKRKTFALLALFGALMWVVVYAALTYFGGSTAFIVPIAVGLSKRVIDAAAKPALAATLEQEVAAQQLCANSADFGEGVSALSEKRDPNFSGT